MGGLNCVPPLFLSVYAVVVQVNDAPVLGVWVGVNVIVRDSPGLMRLLLPLFAVMDISPAPTVGAAQLRPTGAVMVAEETKKPAGMAIVAEPKLFPASRSVILNAYCWFVPVWNVAGLMAAVNEREP